MKTAKSNRAAFETCDISDMVYFNSFHLKMINRNSQQPEVFGDAVTDKFKTQRSIIQDVGTQSFAGDAAALNYI